MLWSHSILGTTTFAKRVLEPGTVAQASKPSTLGGQHDETPSLLKIKKISWAWWRVPVIPATQEAEAGELPEPRRGRLR